MEKLLDLEISEIKQLRMNGLSLKQIEKQVNRPRSTISHYCKGLRVNNPNNNQHQPLASARMGEIWAERRNKVRENARAQWNIIKNDPQMLAMIAFYWAEGGKRSSTKSGGFDFSNSDPGAIRFMFLVIKKLGFNTKLDVRIYSQQNSIVCKEAWEKIVDCPIVVRTYPMRTQHRLYSKYGVGSLRVIKAFELWHSVMEWINCWRAEMCSEDGWQM